ncbi:MULTISPECIES: enoyl-CoA hydratase/isomerase family protein [unclassified Mesorhizobium]|jgi:enoyl-CoA hydratase/carnithine racemase|uniref:enoyl-CoA hydratase/isomerase family protein n=1 Tax=unclassified Mesorhizobium TaxID=325217 RepID=UPI000FE2C308|nr:MULTISPECIES: enoyl-CoA hydratase/isomerase family protein [unclassified Mesorhizobium]MDG4898189.1 enoyl-CoA hydratase/isomerase family protein [Mesorhizobium sp. WSM4976]RWH72672.1 MAG: enoyl-CoA hydratase/isomerase family protein [Mesorhizobium sp.]RWL34442.1 MAG: enoyl-CoA hydratase/isomerase family protein [Mesorhizobium sp.]RWL35857.1 MAG: enoyl-CoA hydratase/isomerase family protein [Mesorhizobium sp.]RWL41267.1 MAG: enoyl-CoA hydratase/isomerase family protein [Mesorhizobium sp.]
MAELVTFEKDGAIGIVTLRRPEKFNALDIPMLRALEAALDDAELAEGVRVVLIRGEGKGFCAGGDVEAWGAMSAADFQVQWVRYGHRVFDRLARLRQPTIAVLSGHALGGGLELAAACDFRVAETQVKLGFPETSIGVVPGWSGTQRAARRFGAQIVRRMAIGGEIFLAADALTYGIVDRLVETGKAFDEAKTWAEKIAERGPLATEAAKLMIGVAEGEEDAAATEALASGFIALTGDLKAGVGAFRAKQKPAFSRS